MSKHTPGPPTPWGWTQPDKSKMLYPISSLVRFGADSSAAGELPSPMGVAYSEGVAVFWAAAPELLSALSSLANEASGLSAFEAQIREVAGHTNWKCIQGRIKEARAAIAKATGGEE